MPHDAHGRTTRPGVAIILGALAALAAGAHAAEPNPDAYLRAAGRLHPMLVHFPIGLLLPACAIEMWAAMRRRVEVSPSAFVCVLAGALGALAAATTGWLTGEFEPQSVSLVQTIFLHRWIGVATASAGTATLLLGAVARARPASDALGWYRAILIVTALGAGLGGHLGGTIVRGEGYLTEVLASGESEAAPTPATPETLDEEAIPDSVFAREIRPIFQARCYQCHGPGKKKGNLRLDRRASVFKADRAAWVIVPGDPYTSELFGRIMLPPDHEDAMPREGGPLSPEEIELIRNWIVSGAEWPESGAPSGSEPAPEGPAGTAVERLERSTAEEGAAAPEGGIAEEAR